MRGTRWLVLVLVLALLCLPLALPYTAAGTRLAPAVAQRVSGLQIDYRGGTLAGALQLASLRLDWDAGAIVLRDVQVAMDASCLWDRAICVRHLAIARTDILLEPDSQAAPAASTQAGPLRLPWALHAPDIELGAVDDHPCIAAFARQIKDILRTTRRWPAAAHKGRIAQRRGSPCRAEPCRAVPLRVGCVGTDAAFDRVKAGAARGQDSA